MAGFLSLSQEHRWNWPAGFPELLSRLPQTLPRRREQKRGLPPGGGSATAPAFNQACGRGGRLAPVSPWIPPLQNSGPIACSIENRSQADDRGSHGPCAQSPCLTGFFGAGKTTLLNSHSQATRRVVRSSVLVNEFGRGWHRPTNCVEPPADNMVELDNGCICCSINGERKRRFSAFWSGPDPARISSWWRPPGCWPSPLPDGLPSMAGEFRDLLVLEFDHHLVGCRAMFDGCFCVRRPICQGSSCVRRHLCTQQMDLVGCRTA